MEADRDHGDQVHEGLTPFPVVDDRCLDLGPLVYSRAQLEGRVRVDKFALHAPPDNTVGSLEEAAVLAHDLRLRVAGQSLKGFRDVNDGVILRQNVAKHEGARQVDGPDVDLGIRPRGDFGLVFGSA